MKTLSLSKLMLLFAFVFLATSCDDDDDNLGNNDAQEVNITATAQGNANLSVLVAALQRANLDAVLADENGDFTVFAPTNGAFTQLLSDLGATSLDDIDDATLTAVLLNHVVAGEVTSNALTTGYVNSLSENNEGDNLSLYIDTSNGVTVNGVSDVTTADVQATNGVVHVVDTVILPADLTTFATADSNFSTLLSALIADPSFTFVPTLTTPVGTSPAPFTVLAPTNAAFDDLLAELGANSLADIDTATLQAVLNYHVLGGAAVRAEDLTDGLTFGSLGGDSTINLDASGNATITDGAGRTSNIVATNVTATNGVIHAIDTVLLPSN